MISLWLRFLEPLGEFSLKSLEPLQVLVQHIENDVMVHTAIPMCENISEANSLLHLHLRITRDNACLTERLNLLFRRPTR